MRAAQLAGLETIRADVRELDDQTAFLIAFSENLQRDDLNPLEEAQALQLLKDKFGYNQAEIGAKLGKSQPWISGRLALLKLTETIQEKIITRVINPSMAREISRIGDKELQMQLASKAELGNLTVREIEGLKTFPIQSKYRIIYANPPWRNWTLQEICDLPVKRIVEKDATLFLWTNPEYLPSTFEVIHAWSFNHKTSFVWVKIAGEETDYVREKAELLLIAGRGRAHPDVLKIIRQRSIRRRKHPQNKA